MKTIQQIAVECGLSKDKLLGLIQETFPQATMNSPISSEAFWKAMDAYEVKHSLGKYKAGAPASQMSNCAPPDSREQFQTEESAMSNDTYDEFSTDLESKRQWEADAGIREEFHGNYEAFKSFRRAEGQGLIKILENRHV